MAAAATRTRDNATTELGRDKRLEDWFKAKGISTYDYRQGIPVAEFDVAESLDNQARISEPVDEATVKEYQANMEEGDVFPPVVAYPGPGGLIIVDGNHRLVAAQRAGKTLPVYVLTGVKPVTLTIMTFEANSPAFHGKPVSHDDRIRHAVWMVRNKVPAALAARQLGLTAAEVSRAVALKNADRDADKVLKSEKLKARWSRLPATTRTRLGSLTDPDVMLAATELTVAAGLPADKVTALCTEVRGVRGERAKLAFLAGKRLELEPQIQAAAGGLVGAAPRRPPANSASGSLRATLDKVGRLPAPAAVVDDVARAERHDVAADCRRAAARLVEVAAALES